MLLLHEWCDGRLPGDGKFVWFAAFNSLLLNKRGETNKYTEDRKIEVSYTAPTAFSDWLWLHTEGRRIVVHSTEHYYSKKNIKNEMKNLLWWFRAQYYCYLSSTSFYFRYKILCASHLTSYEPPSTASSNTIPTWAALFADAVVHNCYIA